jgi:serine-type D-Ala-D-Ala carboxypeptidase/endopeptidase (penicillin-binding protein 4)
MSSCRLHRTTATTRTARAARAAGALALLGLLALPVRGQVGDGRPAPAVRAVEGATKAPTAKPQQRNTPSRRRSVRRTPVRTARAATPAPSWTSPRGAAALAADLGSILRGHTRGGRWGVMVTSVTRGDTLFAENPDLLLKPASIMKMMTTGLALERFGPDHRFTTEVLRSAGISNGVLQGDLFLRGGGDPTLSLRFWQGESPMDALAQKVAASGIRHITGSVVADEFAFEPERIPHGWKSTYLMSAYAAPVSALSLNENIVWIVARPENGSAKVELEPASTAIPVTSTVRVVAGSGGRIIARRAGNGIQVSGTIGARSAPRRYSLVVQEPPLFAAGALAASLQKAGVRLDGGVRVGRTPGDAERVADLQSLPLANMVSYMNRESINHFAELMYRNAGRENGETGSAERAQAALRQFLGEKAGVHPSHLRVADGSGLSEADSLTARAMIHLLAYAHRAPWGPIFHASMPVAGESELMRRRMRASPAHGNLHAKTGTTSSVVSLAGYVTALNGEVLAFAFIYNGNDRANARATMDRMGPTLANFHRE